MLCLFFIISEVSIAQESIFKMHLVHQEPTMISIKAKQFIYKDTLKADIYLPVMEITTKTYPCVIFVSGFAGINFRSVQVYSDWAKLFATNGIIGIVYETNSPGIDFDKLTEYIISNSKTLNIDQNKIGIWSCSGNSLLAINKVNTANQFKCHSIYYGLTTTLNSNYLKEVEDLSKKNGFAYEVKDEYISRIPTLIVRAGKDYSKLILNSIDEFTNELLSKNIPFELINYPEGRHAFDMLDNNEASKKIILKTIEFFKEKLS